MKWRRRTAASGAGRRQRPHRQRRWKSKDAPPLAKVVVDVVALKLSVWHFLDRGYFGYMYMYNFCFCMK